MAEKKYESYKELPVYREADKRMKKEVEEFIKKYHPSNDEMYLQLKRYELKHLSKKEKRVPNAIFTVILTLFVVWFYFMTRQSLNDQDAGNPIVMMIVGVVLIVLYVLYIKGVFSQSKSEIARIDKELAGSNMPEFTFTGKSDSISK
ncbi:MAG: hypothetical protein E7187_08380 [Erysipelotrichaceae bacterium]|nr:hypothetical protein [Erysipelotrichaceae bacterium]